MNMSIHLPEALPHDSGQQPGSTVVMCLLTFVLSFLLNNQTAFSTDASELSVRDVIATHQQSMVKLFGAGAGNLDSYGTGILISAEGHVLTVWNHLINVGYLTAVDRTGRRYQVKVVGTSREYDVALLRLEADSGQLFPYVDLSTAVEVEAGTPVLAFSNMFRVATGNEPVSVVHGVVAVKTPLSAGHGRWEFPMKAPVLITDAVTNNSGAAGGLLTLTDGTPVGLIGREIRHRTSQTWVNYSVPLTTLGPIAERLKTGSRIESSDTAAETTASMSDRQLTSTFGITLLPRVVERTPAYIDSVSRNSIGEQAGLRRGDLVVLIDDEIVTSVTDVLQQMAQRRPGQRISMTVSRQQQLIVIELRVP